MVGLIFTILSILGTIALAVIVLLNNKKSIVHITLFIFSLGFAGAIGSNYQTAYFDDPDLVLIWIRVTIFFASMLTPVFYIFIKNFPERKLVVSYMEVALTIVLTIGSMLLALSPWMFTNVDIVDGNIVASQGSAFFYFIVIFMYYLVRAIILLIQKIRKITGVQKAQLWYILAGLVLSFTFILFFNVVMTLVFKNSSLILLTNVAPLIFIGTVGYAIIKHRLMDIRIIIRKSVVYFGALVTVMLAGLSLMILNIKTFQNAVPAMFSGPLVLLIGIILFNPVKKSYLKIANKYFFTSLYNYQAILEKLAQELTYTIDLDRIIDSIVDTIRNTMKLDRAGVLLFDEQTSNYQIKKIMGFTEANGISLVRSNFLTSYLSRNRRSILYQELESLQNSDEGKKSEIGKLKSNMKRIEASLCLPLLIKDRLIGIIVLGEKISKEAYTAEDLNLLESLTNQASIAIENARLYKQIQNFSQTLQQKVDEQTREIKEKNMRLQELLKMKSEFLSIASHQLRTPLTAIRGLLAMQAEGDLDKLPKKQQKQEQQHMLDSANRLSNIVNDLLDAMELEGGNLNFEFKEVNLVQMITEISEELKPNYDKKGITFKLNAPKDFPNIEAEPKMFREALENVIDNAEKYTNKGGVIVTLSSNDKNVTIKVKDTGIGIPKSDKQRLFGKFSRGEKSTYQHTDGSGLGLFIVKNVITEHHGTIKLESEGEGKGTTVIISLPITQLKR